MGCAQGAILLYGDAPWAVHTNTKTFLATQRRHNNTIIQNNTTNEYNDNITYTNTTTKEDNKTIK